MWTNKAGEAFGVIMSMLPHDGKIWFYPKFARWIRPGDELASSTFQKFLDSPDRVIIEFRPDDKLGFDSSLMWTRSPEAGNKPQT